MVIGIDRDGRITPLDDVASMGALLRRPLDDIRSVCETTPAQPPTATADVRLLPPVDSLMEVWAAGVTYRRSQEARVLESDRAADVYELVYEADRPELFFKSSAWRATGHEETVAIRRDSEISVPEPELALVLNARGETVGYTICNDVSSRSIEGANPLYLPQAKVYLGSCAVGPAIRPAWEVDDPYGLSVSMHIQRAKDTIWQGLADTAGLQRDLDDLASYLLREESFPDGVVLSTGTSLVPDLPFTLAAGDIVRIAIAGIGVLESHVVAGKDDMQWLTDTARDTARRSPARTPSED